tara:strand:- start:1394 stop:1561 length:168 start_codon:yes stop_codon:yes gene_type:complete
MGWLNMDAKTLAKIEAAAKARDNAIKEQAKKGMCAPCGEPLDECACDAYEGSWGE